MESANTTSKTQWTWRVPEFDLEGEPLKVYRNLHRKCLSIQYKGKVIAYANDITLKNVSFKVSEKGRQRVIRSKKKNVHAFMTGTYSKRVRAKKFKTSCTYNPYKYSQFVIRSTEQPVIQASSCRIVDNNILVNT